MRKINESPLNDRVWRFILLIGAGSLLVVLLRLFFKSGPVSILMTAMISGAALFVSVKMVLMDGALKKFWIIWLAGGALFLIFSAPDGKAWNTTVVFTAIFFMFRRYKVYRHLTSRRRAVVFLVGLTAFILLTVVWAISGETLLNKFHEMRGFSGYIWNYAVVFLWGLRFFWFFSIFTLFFSIRLHFLKIRPKLAVTTLLICVVPLILVVVMGLVILVTTLGESRAVHARMLFADWKEKAAEDSTFLKSFSQKFFSLSSQSGILEKKEIPEWTTNLIASLQSGDVYKDTEEKKTLSFFLLYGGEIWLVRWERGSGSNWSLAGNHIDERVMDRVSRILRCDAELRSAFTGMISYTSVIDEDMSEAKPDSSIILVGRLKREKKEPDSRDLSFWRRPFYFGVGQFQLKIFHEGKWENTNILIALRTSLKQILNEMFSEKNPLSLMVMVALVALAGFLFLLEALALYFGLRITGGITSAVKSIHRATRRIAEGDLDIKIEIPNEDELGDLAASFNAMAAAVKRGREQAVARERLERDLKTAQEIQEKLLPHSMPTLPGYEIVGTSIPSRMVGGDYFDFIETADGRLGIAIADVSGKGIPAALLMSNLQASLHAQFFEKEKISRIVEKMNNLLVRSTDSHMFVTFFMGILDRSDGTFQSVNAGHNPPLLFRAEGKVETLTGGGLLLGFMADQTYEHQTVRLRLGDVLVLYTDGITEAAVKKEGEKYDLMYGEERLIQTVKKNANHSARDIQSAILDSVSRYTEENIQEDDITLVVIKRKGLSSPSHPKNK